MLLVLLHPVRFSIAKERLPGTGSGDLQAERRSSGGRYRKTEGAECPGESACAGWGVSEPLQLPKRGKRSGEMAVLTPITFVKARPDQPASRLGSRRPACPCGPRQDRVH